MLAASLFGMPRGPKGEERLADVIANALCGLRLGYA
jgi:hypothetical protein